MFQQQWETQQKERGPATRGGNGSIRQLPVGSLLRIPSHASHPQLTSPVPSRLQGGPRCLHPAAASCRDHGHQQERGRRSKSPTSSRRKCGETSLVAGPAEESLTAAAQAASCSASDPGGSLSYLQLPALQARNGRCGETRAFGCRAPQPGRGRVDRGPGARTPPRCPRPRGGGKGGSKQHRLLHNKGHIVFSDGVIFVMFISLKLRDFISFLTQTLSC